MIVPSRPIATFIPEETRVARPMRVETWQAWTRDIAYLTGYRARRAYANHVDYPTETLGYNPAGTDTVVDTLVSPVARSTHLWVGVRYQAGNSLVVETGLYTPQYTIAVELLGNVLPDSDDAGFVWDTNRLQGQVPGPHGDPTYPVHFIHSGFRVVPTAGAVQTAPRLLNWVGSNFNTVRVTGTNVRVIDVMLWSVADTDMPLAPGE